MTLIVTGAAGFIGSNLVKAFNQAGERNIIVVDNLTRADKFHNLLDCDMQDYLDKNDFLSLLEQGVLGKISAIFHQGACSDTMETDGRYMMANNYTYSRRILDYCLRHKTPLFYASSAATYGGSQIFREARAHEQPLNVYGYSKLLFDHYVRRILPQATSPVVGFRYFNVYGPGETHKGRMASVAFHHFHQYRTEGQVKLFEGWQGYAAGCQQRDFVSVEDVVKVNLHFWQHPQSGIYNLGTGRAQTFNDVALSVVNTLRQQSGQPALPLDDLVKQNIVQYIPFPDALKGKYQSYTQADISRLRSAGYNQDFLTVEQGVQRYVAWLQARV